MRIIISAASIAFATAYPVAAERQTCGLDWLEDHKGEGTTPIWVSRSGMPAIYYRANMDVNTDGSAISYHPDDPYGKGPAINNIVNAMSAATDEKGNPLACGEKRGPCYERWVKAFVDAKAIDYNPKKFPRVSFGWMIPTRVDRKLGWAVPCTNQSGPYKGYFVSQTSVQVKPKLDECQQARYLDSLVVNANVLPGGTRWSSQNIVTDGFDLVVVHDLETGQVAYAVNGDRGPPENIGEGSVRLAAELSGADVANIKNYEQAKKLKRNRIQYLIFPNIDLKRAVGPNFTQADVNKIGAQQFEIWGGIKKLNSCE